MTTITIYTTHTGKILRKVTGPEHLLQLQITTNESGILSESDLDLDYVAGGQITPRPTQSTIIDKNTINADGVDAVTISNAPLGATFTARNLNTGEAVTALISGSEIFATAIAGRIELKIEKWPYLDWTSIVEAV